MSHPEAARVLAAARERGVTLATAESMTGGAVSAALVSEPGASDVVRGGIVAYHADLKTTVLGVAASTIAGDGVVSEPTAVEMARGACRALGADVAVATTGVAGPEGHDGREPGTVCLAVVLASGGDLAATRRFAGDRDEVQANAVRAALELLGEALVGTPLSADR